MDFQFGEDLLHYIWRFRLYDGLMLKTTEGFGVEVIRPGILNTDSGPDFKDGRIQMNGYTFAGHIEVHKYRSEWKKHHHQKDPAYKNVILHVVWEDDCEHAEYPLEVAVVELKNLVDINKLQALDGWMKGQSEIACSGYLNQIKKDESRSIWLQKLGREKLKGKIELVLNRHKMNAGDWEETAWQMLCTTLGSPLNKTGFESLSQALPWRRWQRIKSGGLNPEAVVFGVSGLIPMKPEKGYAQHLDVEWRFAERKYQLESIPQGIWQFHRTRPQNFPTLKLAKLGAIMHHIHSVHHWLMSPNWHLGAPLKGIQTDPFWETHFVFGKETPQHAIGWSKLFYKNLMVNLIIPYQTAREISGIPLQEVNDLAHLPPEKNRITQLFEHEGIKALNALETQGLLYLFENYCQEKRCMHCVFGLQLMGRSTSEEGFPKKNQKQKH